MLGNEVNFRASKKKSKEERKNINSQSQRNYHQRTCCCWFFVAMSVISCSMKLVKPSKNSSSPAVLRRRAHSANDRRLVENKILP